jgi:hypothetical protein
MDAQAILSTVRSGDIPHDWNVWPLRVERVRRGLFGWLAMGAFGFLLLIPAIIVTVPANFRGSVFGTIVTLLLLAMLAAIAFGGVGVAIYDIWRIQHADEFYIIMTPDAFLKVTPSEMVLVPMDNVQYVTLRGVRTNQQQSSSDLRTLGSGGGIRIAPYIRPRQPRTSPTLAFVDSRDERTVMVATDDSFESLYVLEQLLNDHVANKLRTRMA